MAIWSSEIKELEKLNVSLINHFPELEKEVIQLLRTEDENVAMLYSRRCLEIIVTDLCECELKRPRKTEPLKGIIDKLNKEEKVASYIVTSMHGLNSLSTYGAHPKDFDPEQVKPALNNLAIILKWYLKYKGIELISKPSTADEEVAVGTREQAFDVKKLEKSVAILPFKNDSPDEANTYFINGLMEEILNNLQKIKDLRVISRTSVEQYRNQTKSIPEIAKELGVNYIVEGSGQKYGSTFRLRTQLIMAAKESHLWGESFQQKIKKAEDIFRIQSQIAEAIAKELKAIITPQEKDLIEKIPTKQLEAYDAYLKGRFYLYKFTPNDLETAMRYFEQAKEIDPNYALAYSGISTVWAVQMQMGYLSPAEAGPKSMEALMKAVELDSNNAEIVYSQACINTWVMWDWEGGETGFKKSIELSPNHTEAHAYYSHFLNMMGRQTEAKEQIEIALKLDPYNPLIKSLHCIDLNFMRRHGDAVMVAREALSMDPANPVAHSGLLDALHLTGDYKEAWEAAKTYYTILGYGQAFTHDFDKLGYTDALSRAAEALSELSKATYVDPTLIYQIYLMAGNSEQTFKYLEKAYNEHNPNLPYILLPIFDILRDDPRFQEIARKMNMPYK